MDGVMYKWCGWFLRWQSRYCVINDGRLDFYYSKQSMQNGEGILESHHISSCEIDPSKTVLTEWTIQVPCHDLVYLKVDSPEERRNWLKLIGSAKACFTNTSVLGDSSRKNSSLPSIKSQRKNSPTPKNVSNPLNAEKLSLDSTSPSPVQDLGNECNSNKIESDVSSKDQETEAEDIDVKVCKHDLDAICNDIKAELNIFQEKHCSHDNELPISADVLQTDTNKLIQLFKKFSEMISCISGKSVWEFVDSHDSDDSQSDSVDDHISQHTTDSGYAITSLSDIQQAEEEKVSVKTFFSTVEVSFADVIREAKENARSDFLSSIRTETYVSACVHYTRFFDLFAGTLLAPLKSDILSNAEKVRKAFAKNPQRYIYMQPIFEDEIKNEEHRNPDSATQAVLWMMRGLRTISTFLRYGSTPGHPSFKNASQALETAYREHLKRHHNFVVQRMFTMGLKFVPSFDHFKKQVTLDSTSDVDSPETDEEILRQTISYCESMSEVVKSVEKIYLHYKIEL